ncbi:uncharacterized protein KY384_005501 [Bacidia gigantensis]|uniref:uncharacterized protein n=1 Tax=Bacidia gigantensis TaxID=2732470 RepID=UPI001D052C0D|nr:uncharacterized protein KY384_005501 [Bacidia gigantensis]KAG8530019.1 hypothetical protein KY384_005501 [Bacidia gigantensis]
MDRSRGAEEPTAEIASYQRVSGNEGNEDFSTSALQHADSLAKDEASRLKDLATDVRDQDDLERDVHRQADQLLNEQADERDQKRLEKTEIEKGRLENQLKRLRERRNRQPGSATKLRLDNEIAHLEAQVRTIETDLFQIKERIQQRHEEVQEDEPQEEVSGGNRRLPHESQRDFLIRTGKITPFSKMPGRNLGRTESSLQGVLLDAEEEHEAQDEGVEPVAEAASHRVLLQPGFASAEIGDVDNGPHPIDRPRKRRRLERPQGPVQRQAALNPPYQNDVDNIEKQNASDGDGSDFDPQSGDDHPRGLRASSHETDDGFEPSDSEDMSFSRNSEQRSRKSHNTSQIEDFAGLDDGNERLYQKRLRKWTDSRRAARHLASTERFDRHAESTDLAIKAEDGDRNVLDIVNAEHEAECFLPHPSREDTTLEGGLNIPGDVHPSLFDYQKTGVRWLWELYSQQVGGIVGDEMGLGKTIQVIAFLAGLHYSKRLAKPVIIVAPATVMKQWVNEFHTWWPPLRVSILHSSGSGMIDVGKEALDEDELLTRLPSTNKREQHSKSAMNARRIVDRVINEGHVLVTTYSGLQSFAELLIPVNWEYAVLDEGHKIRNPNTSITIYCKELRTANRVILSGTPMQNNLIELWSLFDFVFPMRLGTLVNFRQQFEFPIRQGGYANASNLQIQTATKCAETLKDTISPYLLQRFKADVASDLPKKSEQVLFCKLTKIQRDAYENFLASDEMKSIMNGKRQMLFGVDILRKICNHPDLVDHRNLSIKPAYNYGSGAKSGKMQVVKALLELWKSQGHKTLLFAQHRIMLDILERFIGSMSGITYRRMDGTTPISTRQGLIDEFNTNVDAHVFLLTTKVGGLGVNLTGANRVIIFNPDWNPSTDVQARERAWRLGQKREVMIYRLMTAGTIEEKIYHRQLFKQFLINKILRDPKQRQTFQMKDLHDLFSLGDATNTTETGSLFKGTEVKFNKIDDTPGSPTMNDTLHKNGRRSRIGGKDSAVAIGELVGVDHTERFYGEEEEERKAAVPDATNSDARVMEGIFARSGVHAALEHDQIINGKKALTADPQIIEREAKRVATEAAKELKKAGEAAKNTPVGTPTWTGQFGVAGRPRERQPQRLALGRGRGGPSSASILAGLQSRQVGNALGNDSRASTPGSTGSGPKGVDFMQMIREYLIRQGGAAHTQMLIDHFNRFCNTPTRTAEFKAMLTEIATLEKGTRGRGKWCLKEEYKQ